MSGRRFVGIAVLGLGALLAALPAPTALVNGEALAQRQGGEQRQRGGVQARFDYYSLVLSWSPTFCAGEARPNEPQCNRRDGRRFSFVLHGLWPQFERGYPEFCPTAEKPFVPQRTIDRMQDIMPSPRLTIHEYRKHGVCTGLGPEGYYDLSRRLYDRVKVPARFKDPAENQMIDTATVVSEFVAANPGLKPDMLAVVCGGAGNRLREVRVCFDPSGEFRTCGSNENPRRLCGAPRVFVPPVRSGAAEAPPPPRGRPPSQPMLPGPVPPSGARTL